MREDYRLLQAIPQNPLWKSNGGCSKPSMVRFYTSPLAHKL